ncbi:MAG: asparagine synthase (glutamine-hydrolyzing) [Pseudomonadota bacterium]
MCGIAGVLAFNNQAAASRAELERMIHTIRHRGPDGFGYLEDGLAGLAHARLSIIDLSTGDQPIANEDRTIWTVFNGEIFNYVELRAELEKCGHSFRTHSDTETIVHAYEQWGDEFVSHLNGQFAIALWDRPRNRLLLIRDRVGIRPLFVQRDGERLLFASEMKAILAVSRQPRRIDAQGLAQTFTFWAPVGERTVMEGIRSVPPGHMLVLERGAEKLVRYWDWTYHPAGELSHASYDEAAEELRALLTDAVRLQLRADVPVGAYLSGGLDSSVIVAMIRAHSGMKLRTFSVGFDDPEFDERPFQQAMVDHVGTEHTSVQCSRADIGALFPKLVTHTETPILRTAPAPLMMLSQHVRSSGFKVVLTGEGADEVFAGYDLFKEGKVRRFWARNPASQWRHKLLTRLYPYLKNSPVSGGAYTQSFFGQGLSDVDNPFYAHAQRFSTTRRLWNFFSPEMRARVGDVDPEKQLAAMLPKDFASWPGLSRDQYVEAQTLLFGYLLCSQGDRVAAANSIEGRVPFLDHRVIEFANRLPPKYKLRGLEEKSILRHAVRDLLPPAVANRVKQPYRAPDSQSFFQDGKPLGFVEAAFDPANLRDTGYFDSGSVRRLYEKCRSGRALGFADNMAFVGILSTLILDEQFIRSPRP